MMTFTEYFRQRIIQPLKIIPAGKLSDEKIAFSLMLGVLTGCFPILGGTTLLGFILAGVFRQNLAIIQAINWLLAPAQILLIIPLIKFGASMFSKKEITVSLEQLQFAFDQGFITGISFLGILNLYGVLAWVILALPTGLLSYFIFRISVDFIRKKLALVTRKVK